MNERSVSYELSEFVFNLNLRDVPNEVVNKAKMHILDTLGIIMATCELEDVKPVVNVVRSLGGSPESTVVGQGLKAPAPNAALANATMAHSVDYDDTHIGAVVHPSSIIVPTAFAVGEMMDASGKDILEAVIAGYEVVTRLGLVAPALFHLRGFHPTGVIGVFGAALVAGKLINLPVEQLTWALGIAGSLASGIRQAQAEGVLLKPVHPGFASHNGIIAALLAKEGLRGPYMVFEGTQGFFNAFLKGEDIDLKQTTKDLGRRWETINISIKPYPTCHATHSSIDLALILRKKYGIKLEDIEECKFFVPRLTIHIVVEPYQEKIAPKTPYAAKFSLPYTVAVAFDRGKVSLWDFTEDSVKDPKLLKHTPKMKAEHDKKYDGCEGGQVWPARVRVTLRDGTVYEDEVINHKGTPNNPLTKNEVISKFNDNIEPSKYRDLGDGIIDMIFNLEKRNVREVMEVLR